MTRLTARQEAFAQAYIENGGNAADAYRAACPAHNMSPNALYVEAHRLLYHPKVSLRIDELRGEHRERHNITVDSLTKMAIDAYGLAMAESPAAAVSAVQLLGKLHGLIVEKSKNEMTGADGQPLMPSVNVTISRPKS